LIWIATQAERALGEPLREWFPGFFGFPGSGFIIGIILIMLVGLLVNSYVTRRFVDWFERKVDQVPLVRSIYSPIRDVTNLFANQDRNAHAQRVVMVNLGGNEAMGLITRDAFDDLPDGTLPSTTVAVYIPMSYGMGGFTLLVPKTGLREVNISAERAMQLAITGWIKSSPSKPNQPH
jgi:uncharacterized membrane protein